MKEAIDPLSWEELSQFVEKDSCLINGPNSPYSSIRLFGQEEKDMKVILYRDHHAWCPYCQKVWLWLEWKRIPYQTKKASMRCYGNKEDWYLRKVPSGIFPAVEIGQQIFTESDQILLELEKLFGPLGLPLNHPKTIDLRKLERRLFRAWCKWLCSPSIFKDQEYRKEKEFKFVAKEMEVYLSKSSSDWIDEASNSTDHSIPGSADVIFIPYLERMNASLAYYKGLNLRKEFPYIHNWLSALEKSDVYRGTQGDFHTHAHDLPPQMGGCWKNKNPSQENFSKLIDLGKGLGTQETTYKPLSSTRPESIALKRVLKHRIPIMKLNPMGEDLFDQPLRAALSTMVDGHSYRPNKGSAIGLRHLKDRISVPRDMPLLSARKLRQALEKTAEIDGPEQGQRITLQNRFDQNPAPFLK